MKRFICSVIYLLLAIIAHAQSTTTDIFRKSADRFRSLKSIRYNVKSTDKNPFAEGNVTVATTAAAVVFNPEGAISYKNVLTNIDSGQSLFRETYLNGKLYSVNLIDSTYTEEIPKARVICEITEIASMMESELMQHPSKIIHQLDTVFEGKQCYSFMIKSYDTIENGNHNYTHKQILIDQKTMLPLYLKITGAGSAYKEGLSLGRLTIYNEKIFYGFAINKKINAAPFVNSGLSLPNTEMLKVGEKAPELLLKSLSGMPIPQDNFKAKLLLVVFGGTNCPANPLANPMLNRLHSKFASAKFSIINVYTSETSEQVKKYIDSNSLKFPVYLGTRNLNKAFKTLGTPNFYLISTGGKVVRTYNGYSDSLEEDLIENIVNLQAKTQ